MPDTVQEVLLARINRLPDQERLVLQSAAVIGKTVALDVLRAIVELPEHTLSTILGELRTGDFLQDATSGPEIEYGFKHALTHEVAYGSLEVRRRRDLHAHIVHAIEQLYPDRLPELSERIADHALLGEVWDKAVDHLRTAGARAFARAAVDESLERYEKALALADRLPSTPDNTRRAIDVRLDLHSPLIVLGQLARLVRLHEESERAVLTLDDSLRRWRVFHRISQYSWMEARYKDGADYGQRALDIAERIQDKDGCILARHALAQCHYSVGRYAVANELFARTVDGPDNDRAKRLLAVTVAAYTSACSWLSQSLALVGDLDRAVAYGSRGIEAADESEHPQAQAVAYTLASIPLVYRGDFARAVSLAEQALSLCETRRLLGWLPGASSALGWVLASAGRVDEGLPFLERGPSLQTALGFKTHLARMYAWWAEGLLRAGRLDEARDVAARGIEAARASAEAGHEAESRYVMGSVLAASGSEHVATARMQFEQAREQADSLGLWPLVARCHLGLGLLLRTMGDETAATGHIETATQSFRQMHLTPWLEEAERLRA
jgi:tetratricopeptide (TPR) repeat protein